MSIFNLLNKNKKIYSQIIGKVKCMRKISLSLLKLILKVIFEVLKVRE